MNPQLIANIHNYMMSKETETTETKQYLVPVYFDHTFDVTVDATSKAQAREKAISLAQRKGLHEGSDDVKLMYWRAYTKQPQELTNET